MKTSTKVYIYMWLSSMLAFYISGRPLERGPDLLAWYSCTQSISALIGGFVYIVENNA